MLPSQALQPLRPVYLVLGDVDLLVRRAVDEIVGAVLPSVGLPAFNHATYRATDERPREALATARTLPMMAGCRLVVLRDLHEADDALLELVCEYVAAPSDTTVLVLTAQKFGAAKKGSANWGARLQNAVKKAGVVLKYSSEDVAPGPFAAEHARSLGKRLDRAEAELLVEVVGTDAGRLAQEVEKLALYVGDEPRIPREAIERCCALLAEQEVWDLTTGIAARDAQLALRSLHRLLEQDDGSGQVRRLLGLIAWQLRQILDIAERVRAGGSDGEIRSALRARPELVARVRAAVRGGMPGPAVYAARLDAANRAMNSHRAGDRRILEDLVVALATGA